MVLAGNQPYFFPYIGYWQLINAADVFVIADDFNYIKKGWVNRNRILVNAHPHFFNIEVQHASSSKKINELYLADFSVETKYNQLKNAYAKAPYFSEGMELMEKVFSCPSRNLGEFLTHSIQEVCHYLSIQTRIVKTSEMKLPQDLRREYRVYEICRQLGADTMYNAIGGMELYSFEEFQKRGIQLSFQKTSEITYSQFENEFIPNLSIIDVIMFNDKESIREMLNDYHLLTGVE